MPSIDRDSSQPFYQQVYSQIAHGIETGRFPAGKKLPSIRECARELGVSTTTVELAYQKLSAEGYVQARRGSGFVICETGTVPTSRIEKYPESYRQQLQELMDLERTRKQHCKPQFDFAYDAIDTSIFPANIWARLCREVFFEQDAHDALLYNDAQGLRSLREELCRYLNGEHGLACTPEQILIMPTTRDLVKQIVSLFNPAKNTVVMENPGYDEVSRHLQERGYSLRELRMFPYPSAEEMLDALDSAHVVFTTPSCQFPTNQEMPLSLRKNMVEWACRHNAIIIDDEYGWEFQSSMEHTPSLAALDTQGCVITLNTFSNSFTPAICLSYAVLPPQLMLKWHERFGSAHPQVPWQTQAAMTAFMKEGHWRTHIRKMRTTMRKKRSALTEALRDYLPSSADIIEGQSSLYVLVSTNDGRREDELIKAAAQANVRVYSTSRYWNSQAPTDWNYVQIGFAGIPLSDIQPGVQALARAWGFTR